MGSTATSGSEATYPSILIGFTEISGYFHNLREGLEDLGYRCDFIELVPHPFGYGNDSGSAGLIVSAYRYLREGALHAGSATVRTALAVLSGAMMVPLFLVAVAKYDVFIFSVGNSFFAGNLDLPVLKLFGKRVIMPFLGSEVRPRYIDGFLDFAGPEEMNASAGEQRKAIRFIERFADVIVNNPAAGHLLQRPFVNFFCLGIPQDGGGEPGETAAEVSAASPPGGGAGPDGACTRILHTPSARAGKGSDLIQHVVERLGQRYRIEYTEITGRPHADVLERIRASDLVIDQAYSDTPMAAFASEAAWFGVPAVVGGYYAAAIRDEVESDDIPPSCFVLPEELESAIESLLVDPAARRSLGDRAQRFVRTRWSKTEVASRYGRIISGEIPEDWWFDPRRTTYLYGCGLPCDQAVARVSAMIERFGADSLGLGDKDQLRDRFSAVVER
jgi:hypothetical protein